MSVKRQPIQSPRCSRSMPPQRFALPSEVPGLAARRIAADILDGVLHKARTLDEQLDGTGAHPGLKGLSDRDRALMCRLVATILRRLGTLGHVLSRLLDRGIPTDAPRAQSALLIGAAQILWMDVPDHAAVDLSVRLAQSDRRAAKYAGLVNAVLRRCAREGKLLVEDVNVKSQTLDIPPWLLARWIVHYGETTARKMAAAIGHEPSLDLTVKADAAQWASRLHGETLPTGSVRTLLQGSVTMLPGFSEGQWWVQDAAAALPVRLFGDLAGKTIADLCAAPGGKTAQLAQAGARVTAVDRSAPRMARLRDNLARLALEVEAVVTDATEWEGGSISGGFDGILVDAPCTSTGTIRRHPDVAWLRQEADIAALTALQKRLLQKAVALLRPGGTLVYCTCSLEPEEGEQAISALLAAEPAMRRAPIEAGEVAGLTEILTAEGELRTLPCHLPHPDPRLSGLDGFYAARLVKS